MNMRISKSGLALGALALAIGVGAFVTTPPAVAAPSGLTVAAVQTLPATFAPTTDEEKAQGKEQAKLKKQKEAPKRQKAEKRRSAANKLEMVDRQFELPEDKAEAVFELLKPDDVQVRVGRRANGVVVSGTKQEAAALERFVDLLMRAHGQSPLEVLTAVESQQSGWGDPKTHKLSEPKADALFAALAADDVPVLAERVHEGVRVAADPMDQRTIAQVARILRGQRLGMDKKTAPEAKKPPRRKEKHEPFIDAPPPKAEHAKRFDALERHLEEMHALFEERMREFHIRADELHREAEHVHRELAEEIERLTQEMDRLIERRHAEGPPEPMPGERSRVRPRVTTRLYELPPHHAQHLFELLAPDDVRDVIVSRSGNTVTIRASSDDQHTIQRLVDLLVRDDRSARAR